MYYLKRKPQLFLLHFAGGSCYSFDFLNKYLENDFELYPIELPGRGKRLMDELIFNKEEAIKDYFNQIKKLRNQKPFLIYGHSMGATLGLSVANKMKEINDKPDALIVSGNPGPGIKGDEVKRYLLKDTEFKQELRILGGVPEEILTNNDLFDFFAPIMKADFEVVEKDNFIEKGIVLDIPICALMGDQERTVAHIKNWKKYTNISFDFQVLSGNHFFIYDHPTILAHAINSYSGQPIVAKTL
ncbi:thioesterase II family protein [Aquimarina sp. M1]